MRLSLALVLLGSVACNRADVQVVVGQLGDSALTGASTAKEMALEGDVDISRAVQSSSNYSYATLDELHLNVKSLAFSGSGPQASVGVNQWLEIGGYDPVSIPIETSIPVGTYDEMKLTFMSEYRVKGFCVTHDQLVYSTAEGAKSVAYSDGMDMPDDYDLMDYGFGYLSTAMGYDATDDRDQESTDVTMDVAEDEAHRIFALIDTSYVISCFDGDGSAVSDNSLDPFGWTPRNDNTSDYFPDSEANFGMTYLPLFLWSTSDRQAEPPEAETYFVAESTEDLGDGPINFDNTTIVTSAFDEDGEMIAMRGRNFRAQVDLDQNFGNAELVEGAYNIYNGEWASGNHDDPSWDGGQYFDRLVEGFTRVDEGDDPVLTTITNGPDCGDTGLFYEEQPDQPRAKECLGEDESAYWKRMVRED